MKRCLSFALLLGLSSITVAQNARAGRGEATECATFPCTVASISLTDETSSTSNVTIFTPATDGLFRVNVYMESARINGSDWAIGLGWTDSEETRVYPGNGYTVGPGGFGTFTQVVHDLAGQPMTYRVQGAKHSAGTSYNLFITVEELQ